jgi:hypothetical protein
MPVPTLASTSPINLEFSAGQVHVAREDHDRFAAIVQGALALSDVGESNGQGAKLFADKFLGPLRAWCELLAGHVQQCYVPLVPVGRVMKVYVVRRSPKFDFALSDAIAELESQLMSAGWTCDVLQTGPASPKELQQYFDSENSLRVY